MKAVGDTLLYRLSKVSFVKVLKSFKQDRTNAYETFLKTDVPFTLPEYVVKDMSTLLLEQFYPRSEVVYRSGDSDCDHFYIVYEGELTATAELSIPREVKLPKSGEVLAKTTQCDYFVKKLKRGDMFGLDELCSGE